jgi:Anaerobic dehydrogenases, typically selenocysteine-containing
MIAASARGTQFVLISPLKNDLPDEVNDEWLPIRPGTDTALMLALAHTLVADGSHDRQFLDSHCSGWEVFEDYLMGRSDGQPKHAAWASAITGIAAEEITALARRLPGKRVLVVVAHALQRAEHGEQPVWMGSVLAASPRPARIARRRLQLCARRHRQLRQADERGADRRTAPGQERRA